MSNEYDKYLLYLQSSQWAQLRNEALKRDEYHCSICRSPYNLEVHHLKYPDTLGNEPLSDLMTLCRDCHKKLEDYKKGHKAERKMVYWYPPHRVLWIKFDTQEEAYETQEFLLNNRDWFAGRNILVFYAQDTGCKCTVSQHLTDDDIEEVKNYLKTHDIKEIFQ